MPAWRRWAKSSRAERSRSPSVRKLFITGGPLCEVAFYASAGHHRRSGGRRTRWKLERLAHGDPLTPASRRAKPKSVKQYLDLVRAVLAKGTRKPNRTGVDTLSTFNENYEIDLRQGFPLLTTKEISWKNIGGREPRWFLSGDTHIAHYLLPEAEQQSAKWSGTLGRTMTGVYPARTGNSGATSRCTLRLAMPPSTTRSPGSVKS